MVPCSYGEGASNQVNASLVESPEPAHQELGSQFSMYAGAKHAGASYTLDLTQPGLPTLLSTTPRGSGLLQGGSIK